MAHIETPPTGSNVVNSLNDFMRISGDWHSSNAASHGGMLSQLWYRGANRGYPNQAPGVYRPDFTKRAGEFTFKADKDIEDKRLRLEREMISQFRTGGAAMLEKYDQVQVYFAAQHFGMPTRLLDWSTNPLAALFFACDGSKTDEDGFVYAMDARQIVADDAMRSDTKKLYQSVMTMRHPFVKRAIEVSYWAPCSEERHSHILPIRPDAVPGRIGQQSSCFTFHMHRARQMRNPTMITIQITGSKKQEILEELHRVNINQFTIYYDLDHLSREIKRGWGVSR